VKQLPPPQRQDAGEQHRGSRWAVVAILAVIAVIAVILLGIALVVQQGSGPPGDGRESLTDASGEQTSEDPDASPPDGGTDELDLSGPFAIAATSAHPQHPAAHAVDDDLATRWSPTGREGALTMDLGREIMIEGIEIGWHEGLGRRTLFEVQASVDGDDWSEVHSGTSSGDRARPESYQLPERSARYVRVAIAGPQEGAVGITHVRLAGNAVPEPLTRLTRQEDQGPPAPDPGAMDARLLVDADFNGLDRGEMTADMLQDAFESQGATVPNADGKVDGISVANNPTGPGRALRVHIRARTLSGMNFAVNLDAGPGYEEAYLSYRVQFEEGFDFTPYGGKLPGLAGGPKGDHGEKRFPAGCEKVTGENGFSARGMWVSWMEETDGRPALDQYLYHKRKENRCGDSYLYEGVTGMPALEAGRWYYIQHRIRMNDPGRRNGIVEAWLDGEPVLSLSDMEFRDDRAWGINVLYMATFFGGDDGRWKHDQDENIYLDDVVVHGVDPIRGGGGSDD